MFSGSSLGLNGISEVEREALAEEIMVGNYVVD
jgi:hypothetical protein